MEKLHYSRREYRSEYLSSIEWRGKSSTVLQRDVLCRVCDRNKSTDVHHLTYENLGFEDINTDLVGVCRTCHNRIHAHKELSSISDIAKLRVVFAISKKDFYMKSHIVDRMCRLNIQSQLVIAGLLRMSPSRFPSLKNSKMCFFKAQKILKILNAPIIEPNRRKRVFRYGQARGIKVRM